MKDIYIALGSGGGVSSDEVTTASSHVLKGKTYVGADTDDEIGIGTMPNNPAQNVTLNCGQSATIPLGYNPGSKITANSLASQTGGATADTAKVLNGYTFWKDGVKYTGNLTIQSIVNFNVAQYSNLTLIASWAHPVRGPWSGTRIMCKQGSYPINAGDGILFYEGSGTSAVKQLDAGTWYFMAYNYINTSDGKKFNNVTAANTIVSNAAVRGQKIFTSSGIFSVPDKVRSVQVFMVGGGGGTISAESIPIGGAGGGYTKTVHVIVNPGETYPVIIGAGGDAANGGNGQITWFGGEYAAGGEGQRGSFRNRHGKPGGSGGGGAIWVGDDQDPGHGGSDGNDGGDSMSFDKNNIGNLYASGGAGQKSTTRAFGETTGTLYSGGGGGYCSQRDDPGYGGAGGGGDQNSSGVPNTGGGAGGLNYHGSDYKEYSRSGGSGICIVRWGYTRRI